MMLGRPKEFAREEVLEKAMELFWSKGYEATGLRDLLDRMGIGRQSLYNTFGDKHSLFVEAIGHYNKKVTSQLVAMLDAPNPPLSNIRKTLEWVADSVTDGKRRGCMLTNTIVELAPHDREVGRSARGLLRQLENAFCRALSRAVDRGEISAGSDVRALARYFTSTIQGLVVMGKASSNRSQLREVVDVAVSVLE